MWDVTSRQFVAAYTQAKSGLLQTNPHLWDDNGPVIASYGKASSSSRMPPSGQLVATLPLPSDDLLLYGLHVSADGTRLIKGIQGDVVLWNLEARSLIKVLSDGVYDAAGFSPDGQLHSRVGRRTR